MRSHRLWEVDLAQRSRWHAPGQRRQLRGLVWPLRPRRPEGLAAERHSPRECPLRPGGGPGAPGAGPGRLHAGRRPPRPSGRAPDPGRRDGRAAQWWSEAARFPGPGPLRERLRRGAPRRRPLGPGRPRPPERLGGGNLQSARGPHARVGDAPGAALPGSPRGQDPDPRGGRLAGVLRHVRGAPGFRIPRAPGPLRGRRGRRPCGARCAGCGALAGAAQEAGRGAVPWGRFGVSGHRRHRMGGLPGVRQRVRRALCHRADLAAAGPLLRRSIAHELATLAVDRSFAAEQRLRACIPGRRRQLGWPPGGRQSRAGRSGRRFRRPRPRAVPDVGRSDVPVAPGVHAGRSAGLRGELEEALRRPDEQAPALGARLLREHAHGADPEPLPEGHGSDRRQDGRRRAVRRPGLAGRRDRGRGAGGHRSLEPARGASLLRRLRAGHAHLPVAGARPEAPGGSRSLANHEPLLRLHAGGGDRARLRPRPAVHAQEP
mmetsp:Transcript_21375/g.67701  ORF Transcript_21375/g.67701 Transcript_21375/m.67701 type:complete len:488 (+) Transcript_21375:186-1649(+)